jgi:hypothetical protein
LTAPRKRSNSRPGPERKKDQDAFKKKTAQRHNRLDTIHSSAQVEARCAYTSGQTAARTVVGFPGHILHCRMEE